VLSYGYKMTDICQMHPAEFYEVLLICSERINMFINLKYDFDSGENIFPD
jgi:hypothetical protein